MINKGTIKPTKMKGYNLTTEREMSTKMKM